MSTPSLVLLLILRSVLMGNSISDSGEPPTDNRGNENSADRSNPLFTKERLIGNPDAKRDA